MLAAQAVATGDSEIVIAGGQENMSAAPHVLPNSRDGQRMGDWKMVDTMIVDGLWDVYNQYHMGITAENVAKKYDISRAAQDALALGSQTKAAAAQDAGKFKDEIVAVNIPQKKGDPVVFDNDEFINRKTNAEALAGLRPAFDKAGGVTAGNASGLNDGAAAVVVMSAKKAAALGLKPLGRIASYRHHRPRPGHHGHGPGAGLAARRCSAPAGRPQDLDLLEINEAFAAQACAVNKEMGWDIEQGQRQRRRHRHRPPDRRVGLPHPGDAAARDAAPRREEGHRLAVHRRRHGRCPDDRALSASTACTRCRCNRSVSDYARHSHEQQERTHHEQESRIRHRRHGRHRNRHLPAPAQGRLQRHRRLRPDPRLRQVAGRAEGAGLHFYASVGNVGDWDSTVDAFSQGQGRARHASTCWSTTPASRATACS